MTEGRGAMRYVLDPATYFRGPRDIPRLLMGLVFLFSAFNKNMDPLFFMQVISQYHRVPLMSNREITLVVVIGIVVAEYLVGLCAVFRLAPRLTVIGALALNAIFIAVLGLHWGETLELGCGCFGFDKETVVGLNALWKNFLLALITIAAGVVAFTERPRATGAPADEAALGTP